MVRYLVSRLAVVIPVVLVVLLITFTLVTTRPAIQS